MSRVTSLQIKNRIKMANKLQDTVMWLMDIIHFRLIKIKYTGSELG